MLPYSAYVIRSAMRGFSIVEVILVIIIIGILSSVSMVIYMKVREDAQVTAVIAGLKQIDDAFSIWANKDKLTDWPPDNILGGGIPLSTFIQQNPTLNKYLNAVPSVPGVETREWFYDNDMDSKLPCDYALSGTNIMIYANNAAALAQKIDNKMDDGNLSCGRIRLSEKNSIVFVISNSWKVEKR